VLFRQLKFGFSGAKSVVGAYALLNIGPAGDRRTPLPRFGLLVGPTLATSTLAARFRRSLPPLRSPLQTGSGRKSLSLDSPASTLLKRKFQTPPQPEGNSMKTRTRNTIKVIPLFAILMAFAIAGTGAKSAAEWPPAACQEADIGHDTMLWTDVSGTASAVRQKVVLPVDRLRKPE